MSHGKTPVYLGTVAIEPNRWEPNRVPEQNMSGWVERALESGFDGVELWENHYLSAPRSEQQRLEAIVSKREVILNSYTWFGDSGSQGISWRDQRPGEAARSLSAHSIKFNLGPDEAETAAYREHLKRWIDTLPPGINLLCECHPGTIVDSPQSAESLFSEQWMSRVSFIVHPLNLDAVTLMNWLDTGRVTHAHVQARTAPLAATTGFGDRIRAVVETVPDASFTIEFTHETAKENETTATAYEAALNDGITLRAFLEAL